MLYHIIFLFFFFVTVGKSNDKNFTGLEVFDMNKVFSYNQLTLLRESERLSHSEVIDITRSVGDHLHLNSRYILLFIFVFSVSMFTF